MAGDFRTGARKSLNESPNLINSDTFSELSHKETKCFHADHTTVSV